MTAVTNQTEQQASESVKITGAASDGTESSYVQSETVNGISGLSVKTINGERQTYSAAVTAVTSASLPTDFFVIEGSATKTIRILRIELSATQNTAAVRDVILLKRSTLNTGGTATTLTNVSHDSSNAAGTAIVKVYTANPTSLGTLVGQIRSNNMGIPAQNLNASIAPLVWDFTTRHGQGLILRGVNEMLAVNLNSVSSGGNSWNISIEWTEE